MNLVGPDPQQAEEGDTGSFVGGAPGAIAGWPAMATPALLNIPLVHFVGKKMDHPRIKGVLQTVVIASAGLLLAVVPLARDALIDPVTIGIAVATVVPLLTTELDDDVIRDGVAFVLASLAIGLAFGIAWIGALGYGLLRLVW